MHLDLCHIFFKILGIRYQIYLPTNIDTVQFPQSHSLLPTNLSISRSVKVSLTPSSPTEITHQHNAPCPLWMGVQWGLSSWAACTSCAEWEDILQQTLAPPASVAYRQEPAAWSPESYASNFTCEKLEEIKTEVWYDWAVQHGRGVLISVKWHL